MAKQIVESRVEEVFAQAAALDQAGRLRSTIYCLGRKVYILNQDLTVLIQFRLRERQAFSAPFSFRANDYDSKEFQEEDGRIEFVKREGQWKSVKSCSTPNRTPADVEQLFRSFDFPEVNPVTIGQDVLPLLDESLSHIEVSAKRGKLRIVQRNIYDGSVLRISMEEARQTLGALEAELPDFGPLGLRTNDFIALYTFVSHLSWRFAPDVAWFESPDPAYRMRGLISQCVYDELGRIENGWQEPKERKREQSAD